MLKSLLRGTFKAVDVYLVSPPVLDIVESEVETVCFCEKRDECALLKLVVEDGSVRLPCWSHRKTGR